MLRHSAISCYEPNKHSLKKNKKNNASTFPLMKTKIANKSHSDKSYIQSNIVKQTTHSHKDSNKKKQRDRKTESWDLTLLSSNAGHLLLGGEICKRDQPPCYQKPSSKAEQMWGRGRARAVPWILQGYYFYVNKY